MLVDCKVYSIFENKYTEDGGGPWEFASRPHSFSRKLSEAVNGPQGQPWAAVIHCVKAFACGSIL